MEKTEQVLIIDDSLVQAARLRDIIEEDYEVTVVHTAVDGLNRAVAGDYSLILLDVILPDGDGFDLLKKLQENENTKHLPVILITSLAAIEHEQLGLTLGAVDYITKPFHPLIVKARVNTHIKLYQYRRQVETQSMTDPLTGVANRRRHDRYSVMKWQEAARLQIPVSISMFDIDKFKAYNDSFGHPAGDKVIAAVAKVGAAHLRRTTDFFARYGGEEFVAIMLGKGSAESFAHMQTIRRDVEELQIPHSPEAGPCVTISIGGVTVIPTMDSTYDSFLKIADAMLYDAKKLGRNQVVWADEGLRQLREKKKQE